jgi:Na+/proline symporter
MKTFLIIILFFLFSQTPATAQHINLRNMATSPYSTIFYIEPNDYLRVFVNIAFGSAGVIAFLFLLIGGIQWITAGGDKDAIDKARKKIMGAVVGLAVTFSLYVIVFVIGYLFGINLQQFNIPTL